jgi:hypothetical protein
MTYDHPHLVEAPSKHPKGATKRGILFVWGLTMIGFTWFTT